MPFLKPTIPRNSAMTSPSPLRLFIPALISLTLIGCGDCGNTTSDQNPEDLGAKPDMASPDMADLQDAPDAAPDASVDMPAEDSLAPVIMITSSTSPQPDGSYTLTGTAVDNESVTDLFYTIDGSSPQPLTLRMGSFSSALTLPDAAVTLTVTASDAAGNQSSQSINIMAPPFEIEAAFTVEGMPWLHEPLIFDASGVAMPSDQALTFTWDFGDGEEAQGDALAHAFHTEGPSTITLTVTAEDGRTATASRDLTIVAPMAQGSTSIQGHVTDERGFALPHVDLFLSSDLSTPIGRTDIKGRYTITLDAGITSMVSFRKQGWAHQLQRIALPAGSTSGSRDVSMRRVGEQIIVEDLDLPTDIELGSGTRLSLPAQPFVYADDAQPVVGQALIEITPITPVDGQVSGFPGSFSALRQGFLPTELATHGAVEVTLSQAGEPIKLAPGVEATLDIPLGTDPPIGQMIDLWSLDPRNGYWVWEGTGEVITSPMNNNIKVLRAQVSHFSVWNADEPVPMRSVALEISAEGLASQVSDLSVKTSGETSEGAVVEGTTTVHQGLDSGASSDVNVRVPIDHNARIEVGSEEGCLYGSLEVNASDTKERFTLVTTKTNSIGMRTRKLTPGQPETFSPAGLLKETIVSFDEVPGQYWRLTARATSPNGKGYVAMLAGCGGTTISRLHFDESNGASSLVIEPGRSDTRALIVRPGSAGTEVELTLEALNAPAQPGDGSLSQRQTLTWQDNSTQDSWVYMNAGQVAHLVLSDTAPPNANLSFVTPSGETRSPLSTPFTSGSRIFTASESGWHLLVINPQAAPSSPQDYYLVIGEVFPEESLTYTPDHIQRAYTETVRQLGPGDIQRFKVAKPGDHVWFLSPRRDASSVATTAPRVGGAVVSVNAPRSTDESYVLAEQTSDFTLEFFVLTPQLEPLAYTLDTNLIPRDQPTVRVGDAPCLDTRTTSVHLGAAALAEGGTLEICGGKEYALFDGLNLRKRGIRIKGLTDNTTKPRLTAWEDESIIRPGQRNLIELSELDIVLTGTGLELRLNDLDFGAFIVEKLTLSGTNTTTKPALQILGSTSFDWSQAPMPARIEEVDLDVDTAQGLRVENVEGLIMSQVSIAQARERGIYANNVARSTFSDLTIQDAVQAFEVTGLLSHGNLIDGITTSHNTPTLISTLGTSSITIQDYAPAVMGMDISSSAIKDAHVLLGYDNQTGITLRNAGQNPSAFEVDGAFIDGQELANTTGIHINPSANDNTLKIVNAIVRDVTISAIEVGSAQKFIELIIAHSTLWLGDAQNTSRRDIIKLTNASASTFLKLINTIFVGPDQASGVVVGANLYAATIDAPLGELRHNLFHDLTHPYARQSLLPFTSPDASTDVLDDPMFSSSMLELDPMSPAIDAGIMNNFVVLDYLGAMRPQGAAPDIGAYEQQ
jgi:PKD repeat protein